MTRTPHLSAGIFLSLVAAAAAVEAADIVEPVSGTALGAPRGFDVEEDLQNDRAAFRVRISVDHEDRIYAKGELMRVTVKSEQDGYLYLIYKQADGSTKCLFPNVHESDNRITGKEPITIPTPKQRFKLRCNRPFGEELLVAVVSKRPLTPERLGVKTLTQGDTTDVDLPGFARSLHKGMGVEGNLPAVEPGQWAEHSVRIRAVPNRNVVKSPARRLGLFIGISQYEDTRIPALHVCHKDARSMADVMKNRCGLDDDVVLVNREATRENIEKAFQKLKRTSHPGDVIFIYWSGHGAQCKDTGGEEEDGSDEVLVPYDGDRERPEQTMIVDDAFGRWIQALDGRKVVIILDSCHSGGQAAGKQIKGFKHPAGRGAADAEFLKGLGRLGKPATAPSAKRIGMQDDFLVGEMAGIKDIGQENTVALSSSRSDEYSAERRDGTFSVMTWFLRKKIIESDSLTLKEAYDFVKAEVPAYMEEHFKGWRQTPQLCPEAGATEIRLK